MITIPAEYWQAASLDSLIEVAACQHLILNELAELKAHLTHQPAEQVMKQFNEQKKAAQARLTD